MATPFNVEFAVSDPPEEAQARAVSALAEPARGIGMRLAKRGPGELRYRPTVRFPWLITMLRNAVSGEKMTASFEPADAGGTRVTISGAVVRGKHALASDAEHWSEALTG